jgi:hypothetical protein
MRVLSDAVGILSMKEVLTMKRALVIAIVISLPVVSAVVVRAHIVWERETITQLLWNEHEAYLMIGMRRTGWWGNYAQLAWYAALNYFRIGTPARDTYNWVTVMRCTGDGVEQHLVPGPTIPTYVYENRVYGRYQGTLAKWTGTFFERISEGEEKRVEAGRSPMGEFSAFNGWSKRLNILSGPAGESEYPLRLGGQTMAMKLVIDRQGATKKTIYLNRPGQPPQKMWELDERAQYVTWDEYNALLKGPSQ